MKKIGQTNSKTVDAEKIRLDELEKLARGNTDRDIPNINMTNEQNGLNPSRAEQTMHTVLRIEGAQIQEENEEEDNVKRPDNLIKEGTSLERLVKINKQLHAASSILKYVQDDWLRRRAALDLVSALKLAVKQEDTCPEDRGRNLLFDLCAKAIDNELKRGRIYYPEAEGKLDILRQKINILGQQAREEGWRSQAEDYLLEKVNEIIDQDWEIKQNLKNAEEQTLSNSSDLKTSQASSEAPKGTGAVNQNAEVVSAGANDTIMVNTRSSEYTRCEYSKKSIRYSVGRFPGYYSEAILNLRAIVDLFQRPKFIPIGYLLLTPMKKSLMEACKCTRDSQMDLLLGWGIEIAHLGEKTRVEWSYCGSDYKKPTAQASKKAIKKLEILRQSIQDHLKKPKSTDWRLFDGDVFAEGLKVIINEELAIYQKYIDDKKHTNASNIDLKPAQVISVTPGAASAANQVSNEVKEAVIPKTASENPNQEEEKQEGFNKSPSYFLEQFQEVTKILSQTVELFQDREYSNIAYAMMPKMIEASFHACQASKDSDMSLLLRLGVEVARLGDATRLAPYSMDMYKRTPDESDSRKAIKDLNFLRQMITHILEKPHDKEWDETAANRFGEGMVTVINEELLSYKNFKNAEKPIGGNPISEKTNLVNPVRIVTEEFEYTDAGIAITRPITVLPSRNRSTIMPLTRTQPARQAEIQRQPH